MRLVVGLGNPGPKYERNRHNIGFMAVDELVHRHSFGPWRTQFQAQTSTGSLGGEKLLILKPSTYMNESGRAVGEAMRFFKLNAEDVIVLYDDLDLAPAKLKVKQGGGHGGHNGLRSMDAHIGQNYWRIRIGIGHPGDKSRVSNYVLSDFSKAEWPEFERLLEGISDRFDLMLGDKPSDFTSKLAMDLRPEPAKKEKKQVQGATKPTLADTQKTEEPSGLAHQLKRWVTGTKD